MLIFYHGEFHSLKLSVFLKCSFESNNEKLAFVQEKYSIAGTCVLLTKYKVCSEES